MSHQHWMALALEQAQLALKENEVPVGAVLVHNDQLIAAAHNQPLGHHDPSAHAEIQVLRKAAQVLQNYRLNDCTLYVTLEPCMMCVGAMVHARVSRVVFGAFDPKTGVMESVDELQRRPYLNHQIAVTGGVMADECASLLQQFFKARRDARKQ